MIDFRFHHFVCDKEGNVEMDIFTRGSRFAVHFPRYENADTKYFKHYLCFTEMCDYQVGMLIFAYDEEEFQKFLKAYEKAKENFISLRTD